VDTSENALFSFQRVTVEINGSRLLGPITTKIHEGGVTVVLGPSGAGKSTLLRLCNRLEVPTAGTVFFRTDDVARLDPLSLRRRVGMMFQRPTLFAGTLADNLREADPGARTTAMGEGLERVGLPGSFLGRRREELSVGEAQRACLARALLAEPEALLMDEPTSALDLDNRLAVEKLACDLAAEGHSVVWVTHDLEQAERLADHRVVLVEGRIASEEEMRAFLRQRSKRKPPGEDDLT
jgi:UDP-glucose/iron transport system ATP-binding protein